MSIIRLHNFQSEQTSHRSNLSGANYIMLNPIDERSMQRCVNKEVNSLTEK